MPKIHIVRQGENIETIALRYGLTVEKILNDPENMGLKDLRNDANILYPGDLVAIPERVCRYESVATDQRHSFRRTGMQRELKLVLLDEEDQPRTLLHYRLDLGSKVITGKTDENGKVEHQISLHVDSALLLIEGEDPMPLGLSFMDPIDTTEGVQGRLENLGYYEGDVDGELGPQTTFAIRKFQQDYDLEVSGEMDDATCNKLEEVYGS